MSGRDRAGHCYEVYGLNLHSEVELHGLRSARGGPDIVIRSAKLVNTDHARADNGGSEIVARVNEDIRFVARGGKELLIDIVQPIDADEVRSYLLGVLMAVLLRQRGLFVLHAAALSPDNSTAIGFVGDSGWGKTTLARHLTREGYLLMNDDVMAIDTSRAPGPLVLPGASHLKLRPGAVPTLSEDHEALPLLHARSSKRVLRSNATVDEALPLSRLYILEPGYGRETSLEALESKRALIELTRHTRMNHIFTAPIYRANHLQQCARIVGEVPVATLHRRWGLEGLEEASALVAQDIGEL